MKKSFESRKPSEEEYHWESPEEHELCRNLEIIFCDSGDCQWQGISKRNFEMHWKRLHMEGRPGKTCSVCGVYSSSSTDLVIHKVNKHGWDGDVKYIREVGQNRNVKG